MGGHTQPQEQLRCTGQASWGAAKRHIKVIDEATVLAVITLSYSYSTTRTATVDLENCRDYFFLVTTMDTYQLVSVWHPN